MSRLHLIQSLLFGLSATITTLPVVAETSPALPFALQNTTGQKQSVADGILVKLKDQNAIHRLSSTKMKSGAYLTAALQQEVPEFAKTLQATAAKNLKLYGNSGVVLLHSDQPVAEVIEQLNRNEAVEYAVPNYKRTLYSTYSNDEFFSFQWALHNSGEWFLPLASYPLPERDMNAPEAWDVRTDASNVLVAVLDTGHDYNHSDLTENVWRNPTEIAGNATDDDNNGYVDDVYGIAPLAGAADPMDFMGHGTLMSSLIGGKGNNGIGTSGVAWTANIMALKVSDDYGFVVDSAAIEAIEYLIQTKARLQLPRVILHIASGSPDSSPALKSALDSAAAAGILVVAAAGNENVDTALQPAYPAAFAIDNIISVGASSTAALGKEQYSNFSCSAVDVLAPGKAIFGAMPQENLGSVDSTSGASALVAGTAALVWAEHPEWNWAQVKNAVLSSSKYETDLQGLSLSQGNVQVDAALAYDPATPVVWGISPATSRPGSSTITISGRNFGSAQGKVVLLQGTAETELPVTSWSAEKITLTLPAQQSYGQHNLLIKAATDHSSVKNCLLVSDQAEHVADLLQARTDAISFTANNQSWVIGGNTSYGTTATVEKVDLTTYKVSTDSKWAIPVATQAAASGVIDGKLYIAGGFDKNYSTIRELQIFNPDTATWSSGAPLPGPLAYAASAVLNGKLYVFGGLKNVYEGNFKMEDIADTTYIYDPTTNIWSTAAALSEPVWGNAATVDPSGNGILVAGGYTDLSFQPINKVQLWTKASNTWSEQPSLQKPRARFSMLTYKDVVYALYGANGTATAHTTGEVLINGHWDQATYATTPLLGAAAAQSGTSGYLLGGQILVQYPYEKAMGNSAAVWKFPLANRPDPVVLPPEGQPEETKSSSGSGGIGLVLPLLALWAGRRFRLNKTTLGLVAAAMATTATQAVAAENQMQFSPAKQQVPYKLPSEQGRLLVKFKQQPDLQSFAAGQQKVNGTTLYSALASESVQALGRIGAKAEKVYPHTGLVTVTTDQPLATAIDELYRSGAIEYAEPDYVREAMSTLPNDPLFGSVWNLHNIGQVVNNTLGIEDLDINAPEAWDTRTNASSVVVAILDSLADTEHEDLAANIWVNPGEIAHNGIDDDQNGYIDDVHGINTLVSDHEHGPDAHATGVAGLIGAVGNNGIGIAGVAWSVQMMPISLMEYNLGHDSAAIEAIEYVIATKKKLQLPRVIINTSWGGLRYSKSLETAFKAAQDAGILVVAAAGNNNMDMEKGPVYPASYQLSNIVSVGASSATEMGRNYGTNHGCSSTDLMAPGGATFTTVPTHLGLYRIESGTSLSAAAVSGTAALLWEEHPYASALDIKAALLHGTQPQAELTGYSMTGGVIRADLALQAGADKTAIWQISPFAAGPGQQLTIKGHKFGTAAGKVLLTLAEQSHELTVVSWKDAEIVVTLPAAVPYGSGSVAVQSASRQSQDACFIVAEMPKRIAEMATPRSDAAYVQIEDQLWVLGGSTEYGTTARMERFDVKAKQLTANSDWILPEAISGSEAVAIGKSIYLFGGMTDNLQVTDKVRVFNTENSSWQELAPLPEGLAYASAAVVNDKVYVFGGFKTKFPVETVDQISAATYIYDTAKDSWSQGPDLLHPVSNSGIEVNPDTSVISLFGGSEMRYDYDNLPAVTTVQQFNPATKQWQLAEPMLYPRAGMGVLRHRDSVYVLNGFGNPAQGGWDHGERLVDGKWQKEILTDRYLSNPAVGKSDTHAYVLGGYDQFYLGDSPIWEFPLSGTSSNPAPEAPAPAPVPQPTPAPVAQSSGGSTGWFAMLLLSVASLRRKKPLSF